MIPLNQEGSLVQTAEIPLERSKLERILILVAESENVVATAEFEAENLNTPMQNPTSATVFQDVPATPVTAQILLLLTSTPKYDKIATPIVSEPQQSSASHSQHTEKLPSGDPSSAEVFPNATEVQMDLLLANQHTIMANQG